MEPGEEAVRDLDLPVFEMAGPAAAGTIPQDDGEGEVLKEKGKAKEESLTHPRVLVANDCRVQAEAVQPAQDVWYFPPANCRHTWRATVVSSATSPLTLHIVFKQIGHINELSSKDFS